MKYVRRCDQILPRIILLRMSNKNTNCNEYSTIVESKRQRCRIYFFSIIAIYNLLLPLQNENKQTENKSELMKFFLCHKWKIFAMEKSHYIVVLCG